MTNGFHDHDSRIQPHQCVKGPPALTEMEFKIADQQRQIDELRERLERIEGPAHQRVFNGQY